ncbi:PRC-barrel domain-containing protein [Pararhodobacter sp. SW119]|uniref:PRC-barrel domain-containing protein n=1 Tax=Pararhodobacter sp. SW119 TaxID=2780075 RepID=UPI001ADF2F77|nr:PRC-barrel domain-containing protein [Pararhodobacter sp. SW119]
MRTLLSTSALIAPFLIGSALAQDPPATQIPADPPADEQTDTDQTDVDQTDVDQADTEQADTLPDTQSESEPQSEPEAAPMEATEDTAPPPSEAIVREQAPNELRVDWITGSRVYSRTGENIGRINDLIFDEDTNEISAAILAVGGFLGIGAKQIAVHFEELQIDFDAREIQMDLTREQADAAPEYTFRDRSDLPAPAVGDTGAPTAPAPLD